MSEVVHAAIDGVLRLIRNRELDILSEDHAIAIAASDTAQVYAASGIRYGSGHLYIHTIKNTSNKKGKLRFTTKICIRVTLY